MQKKWLKKQKQKHGEQWETLSAQLQGDPGSFLWFVSFFFFYHICFQTQS